MVGRHASLSPCPAGTRLPSASRNGPGGNGPCSRRRAPCRRPPRVPCRQPGRPAGRGGLRRRIGLPGRAGAPARLDPPGWAGWPSRAALPARPPGTGSGSGGDRSGARPRCRGCAARLRRCRAQRRAGRRAGRAVGTLRAARPHGEPSSVAGRPQLGRRHPPARRGGAAAAQRRHDALDGPQPAVAAACRRCARCADLEPRAAAPPRRGAAARMAGGMGS